MHNKAGVLELTQQQQAVEEKDKRGGRRMMIQSWIGTYIYTYWVEEG